MDVPAALESLRAAATYVDFEALTAIATFSTPWTRTCAAWPSRKRRSRAAIFNDNLAGVHVPLANGDRGASRDA